MVIGMKEPVSCEFLTRCVLAEVHGEGRYEITSVTIGPALPETCGRNWDIASVSGPVDEVSKAAIFRVVKWLGGLYNLAA
jgi:hypothetical protein